MLLWSVYSAVSTLKSDWTTKELCLRTVLNHGRITVMFELLKLSTIQMACWLLFRKSSGWATKQESHRISIYISDKSLFPSSLASPVVLKSRQCWAVMSGQCTCIVFESIMAEVSWQTQRSGQLNITRPSCCFIHMSCGWGPDRPMFIGL